MSFRLVPAGLIVALLCCPVSGGAQTRYASHLRFRVLKTPHFTIYYHQGEDGMARRLAGIAETTREEVARLVRLDAPSHTHVVLVDQTDISNGWSTPLPYNTIEIAAIPAPPASLLGNSSDWLRLVFVHEYAHIVHLDRVAGWMRALRWTLGRSPASFPNLFLPQWHIEGFATYAESAITGEGRNRAPDVTAIMDGVASVSGGLSIDRAGGGLAAWPGGNGPYFYGGRFLDTLARQSDPARLGDLARRTSAMVPYLGGGAFKGIFGQSAAGLWRTADLGTPIGGRTTGSVSPLRRLTSHGFFVTGPRYVRAIDGQFGGLSPVVYSVRNPDRFPEIREYRPNDGRSQRVTTRFLGDTLSSDGRWVYFDQVEYAGPIAQFADLYAVELRTSRVVRLTRGKRLSDPDISPDRRRLAAVATRTGERALVFLDVMTAHPGSPPELSREPSRAFSEPGCQFSTPRWSADGRTVAAVRQCRERLPEVVVIDVRTGTITPVEHAPVGRNLTPAWMTNRRTLLYASDRDGHRFQLYGVDIGIDGVPREPARLVMSATGGIVAPDVSPDDRSVVFVSVTGDGYDVFEAPLPSQAEADDTAPPAERRGEDRFAGVPPAAAASTNPDRGYSPWATLWPRAWAPVLAVDQARVDLGASLAGTDVLGHHAYRAGLTWQVARPAADLRNQRGARPEYALSYAYDRWRPAVVVSLSERLDVTIVQDQQTSRLLQADVRTREAFVGIVVPWRQVRHAQRLMFGVDLVVDRLAPGADQAVPSRARNAWRAGWWFNSARTYGYSISPEEGLRATWTIERVSPKLGADAESITGAVDARAFLPGGGAHRVVALRVAAGASTGDQAARRLFDLGGAQASFAAFDFSHQALGLVRGFDRNVRSGQSVAIANVDYRFPLVRVERGVGTWPLFVNTIHGSVFADVGSAGVALTALARPIWSVGAELASDLTLGYSYAMTVAMGVAWTSDPLNQRQPGRAAFYVRTGRAF